MAGTDHGFCEHCGAELTPGAANCARCGRAVDPTEVMWPGHAQAQDEEAAGVDEPEPSQPPAHPVARSRPALLSRRVWAGLAAVVAALAVGTVVYVVANIGDDDANPTTTEAEPSPTPDPSGDAEGELRRLIQSPVAGFTLDADSVVRDEEALADGALAALAMDYANADGAQLDHSVARIRSAEDAAWKANSRSSALQADGWVLAESGDVELESDEVAGKFYVLQSGSDVQSISLNQWVVWSNGDLYAAAYAAKPHADDFYGELDY